MEISRWKTRTFTPTWGDNHEADDPCVIRFNPPTVGWMGRWREAVVGMPKYATDPSALAKPEHQAELKKWERDLTDLRNEMCRDLVVAVEGLTLDGRAVDMAEAIEFIESNPGLATEVFNALVAAGGVDTASGKD